jgi:hypothetical protein
LKREEMKIMAGRPMLNWSVGTKKLVDRVAKMGYKLEIQGDTINMEFVGNCPPYEKTLKPIIHAIYHNKNAVIEYLKYLEEREKEGCRLNRIHITAMLNGKNVITLDVEQLERVDPQEYIEALCNHSREIKKYGISPYIEQLQRNGRFNYLENAAASLVSGHETPLIEIFRMDKEILKSWFIKYLKLLSQERGREVS